METESTEQFQSESTQNAEASTKELTRSERGFVQGDKLPGDYGGTIRVYESSGMTPAIWIGADEPNDPNGNPHPVPMKTTLLLNLNTAAELRDQLSYLIDNHFTRRLYPEMYKED